MWRLAVAGVLIALAMVGARFAGFDLLPAPRVEDRAFARPLAEGQGLHLALLGTSLTEGELWPEEVADQLRASLGRPVTLSVIAKNGAAVDWGLTQVGAIAALQPDLLLVEFAINDADVTDGHWLGQARELHVSLVERLRAASPGTGIVLMTMSPAQGLRGLIRPRLRSHYLQYRALAEQMGLGLIDLYPRWLALPGNARGLDRDGLHPDPETAARVIAPVIAGAVTCAVQGTPCTSSEGQAGGV